MVLKELVNYEYFTDLSFEMRILLRCLHNFLVPVGQFSDGCSSDVLLAPYMVVHAHDYSERVRETYMLNFSYIKAEIKNGLNLTKSRHIFLFLGTLYIKNTVVIK